MFGPDSMRRAIIADVARDRPGTSEHTYLMQCSLARCDAELEFHGFVPDDANGHDVIRNAAYAAAIEQGWRIEQDHEGNITTTCPGKGPQLPHYLLTDGRRS